MKRLLRQCIVTGTGLQLSATALAADPTAIAPAEAMQLAVDPFWAWLFAVTVMTLFAATTMIAFLRSLSRSRTWSFGDVLSEEAGNQGTLPPGMKPVMVASSSRTIAVFGLFVVISGFFGIAYFIVWALFSGKPLDGLQEVMPFFYGSAALFAPYAVNQMKEAFTAVAGGGPSSQPSQPEVIAPPAPANQLPSGTQIVVNASNAPAAGPSPVAKAQPVKIPIVAVPTK